MHALDQPLVPPVSSRGHSTFAARAIVLLVASALAVISVVQLAYPRSVDFSPVSSSEERPLHASLSLKAYDFADARLLRGGGDGNGPHHPTWEELKRLLIDASGPMAQRLKEYAVQFPAQEERQHDMERFPFYYFLPAHLATVLPGNRHQTAWDLSGDVRFKNTPHTPCFKKAAASAAVNKDGHVTIAFEFSDARAAWCTDHYLIATGEGLAVHSFTSPLVNHKNAIVQQKVTWTLDKSKLSAAQLADVFEVGFRLFFFHIPLLQVAESIITTAALYATKETVSVPEPAAALNALFMKEYVNLPFEKLSDKDVYTEEHALALKNTIKDGDAFALMRFDGTGPLLGWATGATNGHQVIAMWEGEEGSADRELYVYESTTKDPYWPEQNGLQKNKYAHWVQLAAKADMLVSVLRLKEEYRARFNKTAAYEFFTNQLWGLDYGYASMAFIWLDTPSENYPCLPPDFNICVQTEHLEVVFSLLDAASPSLGQRMWAQALAHRVGHSNTGMRTAEALMEGRRQGMVASDLFVIPERDEWTYNITRWDKPSIGYARVCTTTVCSLWKAGGMFGALTDSIQCSEANNWDNHALGVWESQEQMLGSYRLYFNDFNSRPPHAHQAERCPSRPPLYQRPADC